MVEGGIEHALLLLCTFCLHLLQQPVPDVAQMPQLLVEVTLPNILAGLTGADIGNAHLHVDERIREIQDMIFCRERLVALQRKVDGIGIAVVPAATHTGKASCLMVGDNLIVCIHKLLALAKIGNGILSKEVGHINQKRTFTGIMETVIGATFVGSYLCADAVLVGGGIIAKGEGLCNTPLHTLVAVYQFSLVTIQTGLNEDVAILLSATCAAHMGLREAHHRLWQGSPPCIGHRGCRSAAVRSWLYHAEGHGRSGEGAPHPHTANTRVNVWPHLSHHAHGNEKQT